VVGDLWSMYWRAMAGLSMERRKMDLLDCRQISRRGRLTGRERERYSIGQSLAFGVGGELGGLAAGGGGAGSPDGVWPVSRVEAGWGCIPFEIDMSVLEGGRGEGGGQWLKQ
jgi:hypothetical protein